MVNWGKLAGQAKDIIQQRGGTDSLKQDAAELKDIAGGQGTTTDKLKAAAQALREPGAHDGGDAPAAREPDGPAAEPDGPAAGGPAQA